MTQATWSAAESPAHRLAGRLLRWYEQGLPDQVRQEAERCLLNAAAAGMGGAGDAAATALVTAGLQAHGRGRSPVLGRPELLHSTGAAVVNAFLVTQNDFDDAHTATIVHPGSVAIAGVLSTTPRIDARGGDWLSAFALACEAQLALATAISPSHYDRGWHSTATCAAMGSAVATGLLEGFDADRLARCLELSALRVVGLRVAHGTLMKGFQVGCAAANGVQASQAVAAGWASDAPVLLGLPKPFLTAVTDEPSPSIGFPDPDQPSDPWELLQLTYKPYPAGIVCSAGIEAALELGPHVDLTRIRGVRLRVHPLVVELAGNPDPMDEMQARVSLPHGVAAALMDGAAGLPQFARARVNDPATRRLRRLVSMVPDSELARPTAILEVTTEDGTLTSRVDEPHGGTSRPLSEDELHRKVRSLLEPIDPRAADRLIEAVVSLSDAVDTEHLVSALRQPRWNR